MNVLVLFTDGVRVLLVRTPADKNWTIPDTARHFPLEWKRRDAKTVATKLLQVATAGVVNLDALAKAGGPVDVAFHAVFGLDKGYRCCVARVTPDAFTFSCDTFEAVLWHARHVSKLDMRLIVHIMTAADILVSRTVAIETIHCVRAFVDGVAAGPTNGFP